MEADLRHCDMDTLRCEVADACIRLQAPGETEAAQRVRQFESHSTAVTTESPNQLQSRLIAAWRH